MHSLTVHHLPLGALLIGCTVCGTGECDAFVSHSWQDDGAAKYACLQEWKQGFIELEVRDAWHV